MSDFFKQHRGTVAVTCGYFGLFYIFLGGQAVAKYYLFDKRRDSEKELSKMKFFRSDDELAITADRTVGNTMEQMGPFLSSLWLHSLIISPATATLYGTWYVATRSIYPFVFKAGVPWLFLATIPNYTCIWMLIGPIIKKCLGP